MIYIPQAQVRCTGKVIQLIAEQPITAGEIRIQMNQEVDQSEMEWNGKVTGDKSAVQWLGRIHISKCNRYLDGIRVYQSLVSGGMVLNGISF